jgi:DNA recombination protein RmuC
VRGEFGKYNEVVDKLSKQLSTAAKSVENLGMRTRAMNRKLRDVEKLPDATAEIIIGPALADAEDTDEQVDVPAE